MPPLRANAHSQPPKCSGSMTSAPPIQEGSPGCRFGGGRHYQGSSVSTKAQRQRLATYVKTGWTGACTQVPICLRPEPSSPAAAPGHVWICARPRGSPPGGGRQGAPLTRLRLPTGLGGLPLGFLFFLSPRVLFFFSPSLTAYLPIHNRPGSGKAEVCMGWVRMQPVVSSQRQSRYFKPKQQLPRAQYQFHPHGCQLPQGPRL